MTTQASPDKYDWYCCFCAQLNIQEDSSLILCDGVCFRAFHDICLSDDERNQALASDNYVCEDCRSGENICFICKQQGAINEDIWQCSECPKFYHVECLAQESRDRNIPMKHFLNTKRKGTCFSTKYDTQVTEYQCLSPPQGTIICPRHICDTCRTPRSGRNEELIQCVFCTQAYHETTCIAPYSCVHTTQDDNVVCLCPRHASNVNHDFDYIHDSVYSKFWSYTTVNMLPMLDVPNDNDMIEHSDMMIEDNHVMSEHEIPVPDNTQPASQVTSFMLPVTILERARQIIPTYKRICKNDYRNISTQEKLLIKQRTNIHSTSNNQYHGERCICTESCANYCLNRQLHIVCHDAICNVGSDCGNRCFTKRQYPKTEVYSEFGRGWGIRTLEFIPNGAFVFEYVGEIINQDEMQRRLQEQKRKNQLNYYIMQLCNEFYIDGKNAGNESRFLNHSCEPNLELQSWIVKGLPCIGIFAITDIPADMALSFDYDFDTNDEEKIVCRCGTDSCRGYLMAKNRT